MTRAPWLCGWLAVSTLGLGGCVAPDEEPINTLAAVAEVVFELRESEATIGRLTVTPDRISAVLIDDGAAHFHVLYPDRGEPTPVDFLVAASPAERWDEESVAAEVRELAAACDGDDFLVDLDSVTTDAHIGSARCGEPDTAATSPRVASSWAGNDPAAFDGTWSAEQWQHLLDEIALVSPSGQIERLQIDPDGVFLRLGRGDASDGCYPELLRSLDGEDISVVCRATDSRQPEFDLSELTAPELFSAMQTASADALDKTGPTMALFVRDGAPTLQVRLGGSTGEAVIRP